MSLGTTEARRAPARKEAKSFQFRSTRLVSSCFPPDYRFPGVPVKAFSVLHSCFWLWENDEEEKWEAPVHQNKTSSSAAFLLLCPMKLWEKAFTELTGLLAGTAFRYQVFFRFEEANRMVKYLEPVSVYGYLLTCPAVYYESGIGRGMGFRFLLADLRLRAPDSGMRNGS